MLKKTRQIFLVLGMLIVSVFVSETVLAAEIQQPVESLYEFLALEENREIGLTLDEAAAHFGTDYELEKEAEDETGNATYLLVDDGSGSSLLFSGLEDELVQLTSAEIKLPQSQPEPISAGEFHDWMIGFLEQDLTDFAVVTSGQPLSSLSYYRYRNGYSELTHHFDYFSVTLNHASDEITSYEFRHLNEAEADAVITLEEIELLQREHNLHVDDLRERFGDNWVGRYLMNQAVLVYVWEPAEGYMLEAKVNSDGHIIELILTDPLIIEPIL